mmetsp:Transcript_23556/g.47679  ORF Transcript_23556/g.47679 Transcript_23556/m.47679 type:complete len:231 (+) Transcript_23556:185-877(+)
MSLPEFHGLEACSSRVVHDDVRVVLWVLLLQPRGPKVLHPAGVRGQVHIQHLGADELERQQDEACRSQGRLHPIPRPTADLQYGLDVLGLGHVRGDVVLVEPLRDRWTEDHGHATDARDYGRRDTHLVREGDQPNHFAVFGADLMQRLLGRCPLHVVDMHDVSHQALATSVVTPLLGQNDERLVRKLAHGHRHRRRLLLRRDPQVRARTEGAGTDPCKRRCHHLSTPRQW